MRRIGRINTPKPILTTNDTKLTRQVRRALARFVQGGALNRNPEPAGTSADAQASTLWIVVLSGGGLHRDFGPTTALFALAGRAREMEIVAQTEHRLRRSRGRERQELQATIVAVGEFPNFIFQRESLRRKTSASSHLIINRIGVLPLESLFVRLESP